MNGYVAFIRAIGPESHRVMPQPRLCAACGKLDLEGVKSHIASGNLYFHSNRTAEECSRLIGKAINTFGISRDVFTRSAGDLDAIIAGNPFPDAASARPNLLVAIMFDQCLDKALVQQLLLYQGPERLVALSNLVYVDYAEGQGRSKISPPVIERRLKLKGTARNWNTILKMRALLGA